MTYSQQWNLEQFFPGGSRSEAFASFFHEIQAQVFQVSSFEDMPKALSQLQDLDIAFRQADAFVLCLESQDASDAYAGQLRAALSALDAKIQQLQNRFDHRLGRLSEEAFHELIDNNSLNSLRYLLEERRLRAKQQLPLEQEDLICLLGVDGYHGWGEIYPTLVSEIRVCVERDGRLSELSVGQAENLLSMPDPALRKQTFYAFEAAWKGKGTVFAQVLNRISGFRLSVYEKRGWADPLHEPLLENRMCSETLAAMWSVVAENKGPFLSFLQFKAKQLGVEKLAWYDIDAPLYERKDSSIPYHRAAEWIIEQFHSCHAPMGDLAKAALSRGWIEAEDRPGKRPGGYCVSFPKSCQSRIFMTYSGTMSNLATLAHELGHAYHNAMVDPLPALAQHYRMNIAETASTFAEQVISDALLQKAADPEERRQLLADRIQRSVIYFLNIHARFLFETRFYAQRKIGFVGEEDLCRLMRDAQEEAFNGQLSVCHPYFWASKLHFYFTGVPFYNFPYTFGYLFSLGLYAIAKREGPSWMKHYDALLKESGTMSIEELAWKHLGMDLTQRKFWQDAIDLAKADVAEFFANVEEIY